MFVSHTDPISGITTSINVPVASDLFWSVVMLLVGAALVFGALHDPGRHSIALVIGLVLAFCGWGLFSATVRLIRRGWRAYDDATKDR